MSEEKKKGTEEGARGIPEKVDFVQFIFSLGTAALIHLGEIADPLTKETKRDLSQARYTIDLISMLRDKTAGNLTAEESRIINEILSQLQLKYVKALDISKSSS